MASLVVACGGSGDPDGGGGGDGGGYGEGGDPSQGGRASAEASRWRGDPIEITGAGPSPDGGAPPGGGSDEGGRSGEGGRWSEGGGGEGGAIDLRCDDGDAGDAAAPLGTDEGDTCNDCATCAFLGPCGPELVDFQLSGCMGTSASDGDNWVSCAFGNDAAIPPVPACSTEACFEACASAYPDCEVLYLDLLSCGICEQCPYNCDGADTAGDGPNCQDVGG